VEGSNYDLMHLLDPLVFFEACCVTCGGYVAYVINEIIYETLKLVVCVRSVTFGIIRLW